MTRFDKYFAFARIAMLQAATERGDLYGRMLFFAVVLGVFTSLWRAVAETGMPIAAAPLQLVWYLAATEWILLSAPQLQVEIQEEVRRGDVAYQLSRPISYLGALLAQGLGALAVRAPLLGITAFVCAFAFTGRVPEARGFAYLVPFGLAAMVLLTSCYVLLGLFAFWLSDVAPIGWLWQKLLFVLGGLMLPLELYPDWLQRLAALTPFPSILAGPASFLLRASPTELATLMIALPFWMLCSLLLQVLLLSRARRALELGGG